ncbi:MAG: DNA mismatch repair endonuclease MutL [archaeon]
MPNIIVLDAATVNKIAAGEVIERPKSVVKELIENSIDSGATKIFIEAVEGGKSYIKVSDDGSGMDAINAKRAVLPHATSKIRNAEDLFNINSLGFRGEALASIAAVSKLTISTRTEGITEGIKLTYKGGELISEQKIGMPHGTIIEVADLFYSTPARKKYLKSIEIELSNIIDAITKYALIHPDIHFKFIHNKKEIINCPKTTNTIANFSYIFGKNAAKNMLMVDFTNGTYEISGLVSKPNETRADKSGQIIFVNKRFIKNKVISDAANEAYHSMMFTGRNALFVLNIIIDPKKVDVNVHPAKYEVRFDRETEIHEAVFNAVRQTLVKNSLIPDISEKSYQNVLEKAQNKYKINELKKDYFTGDSQKTFASRENNSIELDKLPSMVLHGVANKTYILAETKDELLIIDQHAAAERILYEKFMQQYMKKEVSLQELLSPVIIHIEPEKIPIIEENISYLSELGFNIEVFGRHEILVRTIPSLLGKGCQQEIITDIITELLIKEKIKSIDSFKEEKIIYMSCRAAIKAGDEITLAEIKGHISKLDSKEIPYTCPHGRPVLIRFSFKELEKMFKRTG